MRNKKILVSLLSAILLLGLAPFASAQDAAEPPPQILFENVRVFDGTSDALTSPTSVLVENNMIKSIGSGASAGSQAVRIDGGGRTLMPGLIDAHVHLNMLGGDSLEQLEALRWDEIASVAAGAAIEYLEDGFTTVRDMGSNGSGLKKTIDKGVLPGPRIYPAGSYISQTAGHADLLLFSQQMDPGASNLARLGLIQVVDGEDAMRSAVRRNFALGASQIKIMVGGGISSLKGGLAFPQFTDGEIRAAVEEAAARDSYVAVHVYQDAHIRRAIDLGVMSIEHGQFVSEETVRYGKEKGVFFQGNLAGMSEELLKHPYYGVNPVVRAKVVEFMDDSGSFVEIMKKVRPKMAFQADAVLTSDPLARQQLRAHEKWVWANAYGNYEALKSMTSVAGVLMAMSGQSNPYPGKLGVIEAGAYADVLLVDGNPLADITVIGANPKWFDAEPRDGIETIRVIMKDGKIYKNTLQ